MKIALLSVSNKTGIIELGNYLAVNNYTIISTGGTAECLKKNNIPVKLISDITAFPEILNGRVKTLHPKIFGGILANRNSDNDLLDIKNNNIEFIDVIVVNLYPVQKVIQNNQSLDDVIENIDIGGVSLIRAAAKNFKWTIVLSTPDDYADFIQKNENYSLKYRKELAYKAFKKTSDYDNIISNYLINGIY